METILTQLNEIARNVFNREDLTVSPETVAADVDGWDSLMHITLIVNIEKTFGIKFTSGELARLKKVGDIVALVEKRTQENSPK